VTLLGTGKVLYAGFQIFSDRYCRGCSERGSSSVRLFYEFPCANRFYDHGAIWRQGGASSKWSGINLRRGGSELFRYSISLLRGAVHSVGWRLLDSNERTVRRTITRSGRCGRKCSAGEEPKRSTPSGEKLRNHAERGTKRGCGASSSDTISGLALLVANRLRHRQQKAG
jgi:hypothetical protein